MSFLEFASFMFPYWILGALMFFVIWKSSEKEILAFNKASFFKFFLFIIFLSAWRYYSVNQMLSHDIKPANLDVVGKLPLGGTLFVFWEDLCHTAPLLLIKRLMGKHKLAKFVNLTLMAFVMFSFGLGHLYQGTFSAIFLSFYIPYGVSFAEKRGLGTLMAGHTLYDFTTLAMMKFILVHHV